MTIPFVHKAAVRNSCQWSFFPNHHLLSVHAAQTFLGAVVTSLVGQREEKSCTFPTRLPSSSASPQGSCSSPAFPELQLQSICISSLTQTRENMPTVSLAIVPKPCDSFFLCVWSNTNRKIQNPHEGVTLVWPSTHLSHLCRSEDHCTRKYFTKRFFPPSPT